PGPAPTDGPDPLHPKYTGRSVCNGPDGFCPPLVAATTMTAIVTTATVTASATASAI
ncbi:hypothetical protein A2U01_0068141, partial [Trifolium medium]|nr:hypothetical protein [Trifolium medium]